MTFLLAVDETMTDKNTMKSKKFKKAKVGDIQKPLQAGKAKKRPSDSNNDDSWELAVKKARGAPDGESDGSAISAKSGSGKLGETKKPFKVSVQLIWYHLRIDFD